MRIYNTQRACIWFLKHQVLRAFLEHQVLCGFAFVMCRVLEMFCLTCRKTLRSWWMQMVSVRWLSCWRWHICISRVPLFRCRYQQIMLSWDVSFFRLMMLKVLTINNLWNCCCDYITVQLLQFTQFSVHSVYRSTIWNRKLLVKWSSQLWNCKSVASFIETLGVMSTSSHRSFPCD